jgi:hypothetical protein
LVWSIAMKYFRLSTKNRSVLSQRAEKGKPVGSSYCELGVWRDFRLGGIQALSATQLNHEGCNSFGPLLEGKRHDGRTFVDLQPSS